MVRDFLKLNSKEKMTLAVLFSGLCFVLLLYGYFIDRAVMNIALRKDIEREVAMLNTELGSLEKSYAGLQSKVNSYTASEMGFVDSGEVLFVKHVENTRLTLNNEF